MKDVFKVIGCSCYTCLPRTAPAATQTGQKTAAPGYNDLHKTILCITMIPWIKRMPKTELKRKSRPKTSSRGLSARKLSSRGFFAKTEGLNVIKP